MAMFENVGTFFKNIMRNNKKELLAESSITNQSKEAAKERLHIVLMQDRANVSADFLELMKEEIVDVIKKYIVVDESQIDVRLTNQENEDGTLGAPSLYANIPILNIRNDIKCEVIREGETSEELNANSLNENIEYKDNDRTQIIPVIKNIDLEEKSSLNKEDGNHKIIENSDNEKENIDNSNIQDDNEDIKVIENASIVPNENKENNIENENNNGEIIEENDDSNEPIIEKDNLNESSENNEDSSEEQKNIEINNSDENNIEEKELNDDSDEFLDDDDDDDVTFDDLLKAAEEEEALLKQSEEKEEQEPKEKIKKNISTQKEYKQYNKKQSSKTKKNRKK